MIDKYRGVIFVAILVSALVYIGYKDQKSLNPAAKLKEEEIHLPSPAQNNNAESPKLQVASNSAEGESTPELTPSQVEEIVRSYIMKNPEIVTDALDKIRQNRLEEIEKEKKEIEQKIQSNQIDVESVDAPILGNKDGSSVIVMFYDYNCSYCKQSFDAIKAMLAKNDSLKVILRVNPVLGEESLNIAKIATAVYLLEPLKFPQINSELLSDRLYEREDLIELFKENNIDFDRIEKYTESEEVNSLISKNKELANEIKVTGVPAFVINKKYFRGYMGQEALEAELREPKPVLIPEASTQEQNPQEGAKEEGQKTSEKGISE